jgi:hypothetical protein
VIPMMIRISADSTLHGCLLYKALSYKSAEDEDQVCSFSARNTV